MGIEEDDDAIEEDWRIVFKNYDLSSQGGGGTSRMDEVSRIAHPVLYLFFLFVFWVACLAWWVGSVVDDVTDDWMACGMHVSSKKEEFL